MGSTIFDCATIEEAKSIILTPEMGLSTDERWKLETEWLIEKLDFVPLDMVVDYGCGIGRMSKAMVDRTSCCVVGVDQSASMRAMATTYVGNPEWFQAVTPRFFNCMVENAFLADGGLTVWCLQHIPMPILDGVMRTLKAGISPGGTLCTMERPERFVPVREGQIWGWADDGVSVFERLDHHGFTSVSALPVPETLCQPGAMLRKWRNE